MSLFHKIVTFVFGIFESKQARYHRDCEEAFDVPNRNVMMQTFPNNHSTY